MVFEKPSFGQYRRRQGHERWNRHEGVAIDLAVILKSLQRVCQSLSGIGGVFSPYPLWPSGYPWKTMDGLSESCEGDIPRIQPILGLGLAVA